MTDDERSTDERATAEADPREGSAEFRLFTCALCGWQSAEATVADTFAHLETHFDEATPNVAASRR